MMKNLGAAIRMYRRKADISQQQLADVLGVTKGTISKYERNVIQPEVAKLPLLASALGIDLKVFVSSSQMDEGPVVFDQDGGEWVALIQSQSNTIAEQATTIRMLTERLIAISTEVSKEQA